MLQYITFVFTSAGCIIGPFFEFTDFVNWIEMKGHYKDAPRGLVQGWATLLPVLGKYLYGVICIGIHMYITVV